MVAPTHRANLKTPGIYKLLTFLGTRHRHPTYLGTRCEVHFKVVGKSWLDAAMFENSLQ